MITCIIQARMSSSRLPGKVMQKISENKRVIDFVINQLQGSKRIEKIIVAIPDEREDDVTYDHLMSKNIFTFRGSLNNVLDRYYQCAKSNSSSIIIRITADCPLIDSVIVDEIVDCYQTKNCDYVSNTINPSFPDGLDTEVFSFEALKRAWGEAVTPSEREHVTPYLYNHPEIFKTYNYANHVDHSGMRWVVDEEVDYLFVTEVYKHLYKYGEIFYMDDVLELLSKHPELNSINKNIKRNEGYMKSIEGDKK